MVVGEQNYAPRRILPRLNQSIAYGEYYPVLYFLTGTFTSVHLAPVKAFVYELLCELSYLIASALQRLPILAVAYRGRVLLSPNCSLAIVLYDWLVLRTEITCSLHSHALFARVRSHYSGQLGCCRLNPA